MRPMQVPGGFTLVELVVVLTVMVVLASFAMPAVFRMRESSAIQNGRSSVTSALSVASTTGTQWGRTAMLRIDTVGNTMDVLVDTGSAGSGADTLLIRRYRLLDDQGVTIGSDRDRVCFNSRGVATVAAGCPGVGARIVLSYGAVRETIVVNAAGRVIR